MNCIIIDDQPLKRDKIKILIEKTQDLVLVDSFSNLTDASIFMFKTKIDLIFINLQIADIKEIEFIKTIPEDTFVIFISDIFSLVKRKQKSERRNYFFERFKKGIGNAQNYQMFVQNKTFNKIDDYFVI